MMSYPPFRSLIQIVVSDPDNAKAMRDAERITAALKVHSEKMESKSRPHILGPAAAPLEKLRGNFRMQILIKARTGDDSMPVLQDCFGDLDRQKISCKVNVDVDPLSLL